MPNSEYISGNAGAPVIVLFGGNIYRRDEVIKLVLSIGDITVYGTLDEEQGMSKIKTLVKLDLIIIGSRYNEVQRNCIKEYVITHLPNAKITEPGWAYPYDNEALKKDIILKLNLA